jgi:hypothetical protein
MMTSPAENIAAICAAIAHVKPKRLLDVGAGFGKFGLLARETLMAQAAERGDWTPKDELYAVCVENAKFFHQFPYHDAIYNEHHHVDVNTLSTEFLRSFDLTLLIDVAEHWPKEVFFTFAKYSGALLVSTPKAVTMYTQEYYGKDCPKHETQYEFSDFRDLPRKDYSTPTSHIYLLKRNPL